MAQYDDSRSQQTFSLDTPIWRSPSGHPLMITPLDGINREQINSAVRSLWRYRESLPLNVDAPISLGEGCTPLIASTFAGSKCLFKLEWFAPKKACIYVQRVPHASWRWKWSGLRAGSDRMTGSLFSTLPVASNLQCRR